MRGRAPMVAFFVRVAILNAEIPIDRRPNLGHTGWAIGFGLQSAAAGTIISSHEKPANARKLATPEIFPGGTHLAKKLFCVTGNSAR
jgi:hypothetical protein